MQEAVNPRSPKIRNSSDITPVETKEPCEVIETPKLKVTLERPESLAALHSGVTLDTEKTQIAPESTAQEAQTLLKTIGEGRDIPATIEAIEPQKLPEPMQDEAVLEAQHESSPHAREIANSPTTWDFLKAPLLTMTALACLLVAAWSYANLQDARGQLSSVTEAKVSVEKALADVQARLAAQEKAVADFKAALAAAPALVLEKQQPATLTEPMVNKPPQ